MGRADNVSVSHGSNGSTNLGGSRVSTRDPLTHFTLYSSAHPISNVIFWFMHGQPATAFETVILTVC